ncbi:MoaD/ThiS family protein [bacterium]|nr:MoaD/ThiS family protein [bacterium]
MKVELRLFASFMEYLPATAEGHRVELELAEGTTVRDVLVDLGVPLDMVKLIFANGVKTDLDYTIQDGDRIGAFPPVAGG